MLIDGILEGNFTRDEIRASEETLRQFVLSRGVDLDEVVESVGTFHRHLKRERSVALTYYNETETVVRACSESVWYCYAVPCYETIYVYIYIYIYIYIP